MSKAERETFNLVRRTGVVLTFLAWAAFLVSFFLPTAVQIGSMLGAPLGPQSGWQTFVDSFLLSIDVAINSVEQSLGSGTRQFQPLVLLCMFSPVPNGLMLLAPLANLKLKHYAALPGTILFIAGTSAIWICWQVYEGLTIGYYLWNGSILVMALASFLITGSYFMEDNAEHARLLGELKQTAE
jgi:hypothetical protein